MHYFDAGKGSSTPKNIDFSMNFLLPPRLLGVWAAEGIFLMPIIELTLRSGLKFLKLVKSAAGGIDEKFEP